MRKIAITTTVIALIMTTTTPSYALLGLPSIVYDPVNHSQTTISAIQNITQAIQAINTVLHLKSQIIQQAKNAVGLTGLPTLISEVQRTTAALSLEEINSVVNNLYKLDPNSAAFGSSVRSVLEATQNFPAERANIMTQLSSIVSASDATSLQYSYEPLQQQADQSVAASKSIAEVEKSRIEFANSINDYSAEQATLGDDSAGATMQHIASSNMLNARQLNKLLAATSLLAQQQQQIMNRQLADDNKKIKEQIRSIKAANAAMSGGVATLTFAPAH
jgi:hypothetical protein